MANASIVEELPKFVAAYCELHNDCEIHSDEDCTALRSTL